MSQDADTKRYAKVGVQTSGTLRCPECGAEQPCPPTQAQAYIRVGWPKHCDQTMQLVPFGGVRR